MTRKREERANQLAGLDEQNLADLGYLELLELHDQVTSQMDRLARRGQSQGYDELAQKLSDISYWLDSHEIQ
jgi:hypothetical protein